MFGKQKGCYHSFTLLVISAHLQKNLYFCYCDAPAVYCSNKYYLHKHITYNIQCFQLCRWTRSASVNTALLLVWYRVRLRHASGKSNKSIEQGNRKICAMVGSLVGQTNKSCCYKPVKAFRWSLHENNDAVLAECFRLSTGCYSLV